MYSIGREYRDKADVSHLSEAITLKFKLQRAEGSDIVTEQSSVIKVMKRILKKFHNHSQTYSHLSKLI